MTDGAQQRRLGFVMLGLLGAFSGLGFRLAVLHLGENEDLRTRVRQVRTVEESVLVGRGRILDRNRNILAMDLTVHHVCADPQALTERGYLRFAARHLARHLELDPAVVWARMDRPRARYVRVQRFVPNDRSDSIRRLQLPHVWFEPVSARHYPHPFLMSHVIGFSNHEGVGSAGAEQRMDSYLRGRPGVRISQRDGRGREMLNRRSLDIASQAGNNVVLSLDIHLQQMVESALDEALERTNSIGAWAIVQEVRTGRILAMASRPGYDPNTFNHHSDEERRNRAVGYVFEPGSTFKAMVIAAALEEQAVSTDQRFDCEHGLWMHRSRPLRDYSPHGVLSVADIVKVSSNIGAAKIALELGDAQVERYLRAFGFGQPTGVELPGEEAGILHPRSAWSSLSLSRLAMGHEVGVTALQLLNAVCAIANDGFLLRPTILSRVETPRGQVLYEAEPEVLARPVRSETARTMLHLLTRVTEDGGTGRRAIVDGYRVAGKTGTAQKPVPGGYSSRLNIASFVGVIPAERPELGILVVLDEPKGERTGGAVAAPVFSVIAEQAVRYLGIPPAEWEPIDPGARWEAGTREKQADLKRGFAVTRMEP